MTSPSSTLIRSIWRPSRFTWLPDSLSVKIRFALTPSALSAFSCTSRDFWLVEMRAYPKSLMVKTVSYVDFID